MGAPNTRPAGLAPEWRSAELPGAADLPPMADALVMAVLRHAHAEEGVRGNIPGQRALERVAPALAEGVAALLRLRADGLIDISLEGSTP